VSSATDAEPSLPAVNFDVVDHMAATTSSSQTVTMSSTRAQAAFFSAARRAYTN
jgi:hypothetical protein